MTWQDDSRVAVQITGGLGNQLLFQYTAGRALAKRLGARLISGLHTADDQFAEIRP